MTEFKRQNNMLVARDGEGQVVAKVKVKGVDIPRVTWRTFLRKISNDGHDYYAKLHDIAMGTPFVAKLPDGRESEPMIPSLEMQRTAALDLVQLMDGKAVAQTEAAKAEEETKELERVRAMSDAELDAELQRIMAERAANGPLPEKEKYNELTGNDVSEVDAAVPVSGVPTSVK